MTISGLLAVCCVLFILLVICAYVLVCTNREYTELALKKEFYYKRFIEEVRANVEMQKKLRAIEAVLHPPQEDKNVTG